MNVGYLKNHRKNLTNFLKVELSHFIKNAEYEKALNIANEILISNPHESTSYQIIGKIYSLLGNLEESINYYKKAIKLNPKCSLTYNSLAISSNHSLQSFLIAPFWTNDTTLFSEILFRFCLCSLSK